MVIGMIVLLGQGKLVTLQWLQSVHLTITFEIHCGEDTSNSLISSPSGEGRVRSPTILKKKKKREREAKIEFEIFL